MIHFFGVLELGSRRHINDAEAPNKTSLFSFGDESDQRDELLSPAEQDMLILTGKQPGENVDERRFTYSLALHSL
ncbi:MAG: hypothetical protein ABI414_12395 [Devosia sp.]